MRVIHPMILDEPGPCPYLPDHTKRYQLFYATDLAEHQIGGLLRQGWRKFGPCFFRPACPGCRKCIPVRIDCNRFTPSRSQKRVMRQNRDLEVRFGPLHYSDRLFDIYREHSRVRFGEEVSHDDFIAGFYLPSTPGEQIDILLDSETIGVGFLDIADDALSSVYFCFDPAYSDRNLGTLSVLCEIGRARELDLPYYHLGYWVPGSPRMAYKNGFHPHQHYDWDFRAWVDPEE